MNDQPAEPKIQPLEAIVGFLATVPKFSHTDDGMPKVYARYGVGHYAYDPESGVTTKLDTTFHPLVAYWEAAETLAARFHKGDAFIAQGLVRVNKRTGRERFEVKQIGHNARRTRYEVDRSRCAPREAVERSLPEAQEPRAAVPDTTVQFLEPHRTASSVSAGLNR